MDQATFFALAGLIIAVIVNTAIFVWRLVSVRDAIISKVDLIKAAIDLEVDLLRRELHDHKIKVAEEYMRKDSFHAVMIRIEKTNETGFGKIESRFIRLEQQIQNAVGDR